jgi:hypothetical protein
MILRPARLCRLCGATGFRAATVWLTPLTTSRHYRRMVRVLLVLLLSGCANVQVAQDEPPHPELVARDLQAILAGMQHQDTLPRNPELVAPD